MLNIEVPMEEALDEATNKFVIIKSFPLELEHSLASLSKWEQFFEKPFLSDERKSPEETLYYIQCMCLTQDVPSDIWQKLSAKNGEDINAYINRKMTATWFYDAPGHSRNREIVTAELIYYWMSALSIDWQAQYWHLNTLMTLIKVANEKNQPEKKLSRREAMAKMAEVNKRRLEQTGGVG